MIPPESDVVREGLFRLLGIRAVLNAGYTAYLLVDPPAAYDVLLPSLAIYGLLDGITAAGAARLLYRFRPPETYWMSSLVDGISRLWLFGVALVFPDIADRPLWLVTLLVSIAMIAILNGLMFLVVAASLRQGGVRSRLAHWFMLLGIVTVLVGVLLMLRMDPTVRTARILLPIMFGLTAVTLGIAALRMLRARTPL